MGQRWFPPLLLLLFATIVLAACQRLPAEKEVRPTPIPKMTVIGDEWTRVPVNRTGGWLDTIVMVEEPSATVALDRLEAGELDLYAAVVSDPQLFERTQASAELEYSLSYGAYNELTFNPAGPLFSVTQQLNPFADMRIREAMNYLVDRDYIAREIYGGMAIPRFTAVNTAVPDYALMARAIRAIEEKYAYNPEKAKEIIDDVMTDLGATLENGRWIYNGQPVKLIFLVRTEDKRRAVGDYVADQLESIGFTVDRQYKSRAEADPIREGDPDLGQWYIYTGGWWFTSISHDVGANFIFFYPPPVDEPFFPIDPCGRHSKRRTGSYGSTIFAIWRSAPRSLSELSFSRWRTRRASGWSTKLPLRPTARTLPSPRTCLRPAGGMRRSGP